MPGASHGFHDFANATCATVCLSCASSSGSRLSIPIRYTRSFRVRGFTAQASRRDAGGEADRFCCKRAWYCAHSCSFPTFWFSKMARMSCSFSFKYFWMSSVVTTFCSPATESGLGACGESGARRLRGKARAVSVKKSAWRSGEDDGREDPARERGRAIGYGSSEARWFVEGAHLGTHGFRRELHAHGRRAFKTARVVFSSVRVFGEVGGREGRIFCVVRSCFSARAVLLRARVLTRSRCSLPADTCPSLGYHGQRDEHAPLPPKDGSGRWSCARRRRRRGQMARRPERREVRPRPAARHVRGAGGDRGEHRGRGRGRKSRRTAAETARCLSTSHASRESVDWYQYCIAR